MTDGWFRSPLTCATIWSRQLRIRSILILEPIRFLQVRVVLDGVVADRLAVEDAAAADDDAVPVQRVEGIVGRHAEERPRPASARIDAGVLMGLALEREPLVLRLPLLRGGASRARRRR